MAKIEITPEFLNDIKSMTAIVDAGIVLSNRQDTCDRFGNLLYSTFDISGQLVPESESGQVVIAMRRDDFGGISVDRVIPFDSLRSDI